MINYKFLKLISRMLNDSLKNILHRNDEDNRSKKMKTKVPASASSLQRTAAIGINRIPSFWDFQLGGGSPEAHEVLVDVLSLHRPCCK